VARSPQKEVLLTLWKFFHPASDHQFGNILFFVLSQLNSLKSSSHSEFSMKRTTQEKLREHLRIDKKKSISRITIAGVGQVGTACAYSIMQQVKSSLINIDLTRYRPLWSFSFQKHRCIFSTGNYLIFSLSYFKMVSNKFSTSIDLSTVTSF